MIPTCAASVQVDLSLSMVPITGGGVGDFNTKKQGTPSDSLLAPSIVAYTFAALSVASTFSSEASRPAIAARDAKNRLESRGLRVRAVLMVPAAGNFSENLNQGGEIFLQSDKGHIDSKNITNGHGHLQRSRHLIAGIKFSLPDD